MVDSLAIPMAPNRQTVVTFWPSNDLVAKLSQHPVRDPDRPIIIIVMVIIHQSSFSSFSSSYTVTTAPLSWAANAPWIFDATHGKSANWIQHFIYSLAPNDDIECCNRSIDITSPISIVSLGLSWNRPVIESLPPPWSLCSCGCGGCMLVIIIQFRIIWSRPSQEL